MQVTVIGAGNMGRGIGHRLVAGGQSVTIVDRDPEEAGQLAEELRGAAPSTPPSPARWLRGRSRASRSMC
jgi:8-hydroxy-5-deazaflavin:NADPH oxidoreductase